MRFLTFFLFLCVYGAWLWSSAGLTKILGQPRTRGVKRFWVSEGMIVLGIFGTFALIYLLSGLWNWQLVALFLAAGQLGVVLGAVLNAVLGQTSEQSRSRMMAAGGEIAVRHPIVTASMLALSALILVGYVVTSAIIHFRYPWNSEALHAAAVKYTLIGVIFVPSIPIWAEMAAVLASEELDEGTRQEILINQLAGMLSNALFISLAAWAFGVGRGDLPASLATLAKTFSARVTIFVLAFPMVLFMLPYWTGTQRGYRFRSKLLGRRREFTSKLANTLETPVAAKYLSDIVALRDEVKVELGKVMQCSPVMAFHSSSTGPPPATVAALASFVSDSKDLDPRFQHADDLLKFDGELQEITSDLQARPQTSVVRAAERWSRKYEIRKADLAGDVDTTNAKPVMLLVVGTLVSALVSSVLSDVGNTAWAAITGAAVHK
ncbi:MAG TPA: hypothetical protein VE377_21995 [Candidatus Dormibacteraeota bacterium]|nr:hypothetical protein [Candidatus Dormibacteraeota bacterium]